MNNLNRITLGWLVFVAIGTWSIVTASASDYSEGSKTGSVTFATNHEYVVSSNMLAAGVRLMKKKRYSEAGDVFDSGLRILGNLYVSPDLDDDSGMKLILAEWEREKGHHRQSASIKGRILSIRLELYLRHPIHVRNASTPENSYTFKGQLWSDQRYHRVGAVADSIDDGTQIAGLLVQNHRNPRLPWRVWFVVGLHDELVYDRSLYKVTAILPDHVARERIRKVIEGNLPINPGDLHVNDAVSVEKMTDAAFNEGQVVLPMWPSVLNYSIRPQKELEVIFDGIKDIGQQQIVARLRWRFLKRDQDYNIHAAKVPYKTVEIERGKRGKLQNGVELQIDDLIAASAHHSAWLVLRVCTP